MRTDRAPRAGAALAATLSVGLLLTACSTTAEDAAEGPAAEDGASSSAPTAPTGGPEGPFHEQEIAFESCDPPEPPPGAPPVPDLDYQCGVLEVPVDHAQPDGETAQVALLKAPATGSEPQGSLVLNPGGPGFPGTDFAVTIAQVWADTPVTESFDLIGFDPRGVGQSVPAIDCYTDEERAADAPLSVFDSGTHELDADGAAALYEQCAERTGSAELLDHIGTRDVAQDLDVLRAALGDEQLSFLGVSYGTRLGAVYAEMYPDRVRALVLDGAMDPTLSSQERRVQQFTAFQDSFEQMGRACTEQPDCPLGDDPERVTEEFQALAQPLIEDPAPAGEGRELSFTQAIGAVTIGLYSEETQAVVMAGIAELRQGRGDTLLGLSDAYLGRTPEGEYDDANEATFAINCLDEDRLTPDQAGELKRAVVGAAPFLDTGVPVGSPHDGCEGWPVQPSLEAPYATDIEGLPDTLTVSVTGDPATPHEGGIVLAEVLGGSLLTVEGNQHGATIVRNACVQDAVASYLVDLESPEPEATCEL